MGREQMGETIPSKLCGRPFGGADLETIRREIVAANPPLHAEIARRVCRTLAWVIAGSIGVPANCWRPWGTNRR